jgi:predicted TIM-barrel fold metal-dependent hydrolase
MPSLLAFADPTHITYGSDWPYAPKARSLHFTSMLDTFGMDDEVRRAIDWGNAVTMFPRLA